MAFISFSVDFDNTILQKEQIHYFVSWFLQMVAFAELLAEEVVHDVVESVVANALKIFDPLYTFLDEIFHSIMIIVNLLF